MITSNFKKMLALSLLSPGNASTKAYIEAINVSGVTRFIGGRSFFPGTVIQTVNTTSLYSNAGIYLGSGTSPASESDYTLQTPIQSGLTGSTPTITQNIDSEDNQYLEYLFTVTNQTNTDITINEIGYGQKWYYATTRGVIASQSDTFLLDRTVLSTPIVVPANDSAVVRYQLKAII